MDQKGVRATVVTAGHCTHAELTSGSEGAENAGLENAGLKSDELRLKQPQTSSTIDVSELSQNCV